MKRSEPLARYLTRTTGIEIQPIILPRYGNVVSNFPSAKMDGAFFGSFTYALGHAMVLEAFGARRFILTRHSDYRPVPEYARDGNIDLATYDYLND
jgi:hypothetical protein